MRRNLLLLVAVFFSFLANAQSIIDSCFSSATPGTSFTGSLNLSDATDADLIEWNGSQWIGSWSNANVNLQPPCDSFGVRAIWMGDQTQWTTGGEGFGMHLSSPLIAGVTYTFMFTYVSNGLYSNGAFAPDVFTNLNGSNLGTNCGALTPAGYTWTTLPFTFIASAAQNGDEWIIIHSNDGSGMVLSFCSPCAPQISVTANFLTADTAFCAGNCIDFTNLSANATSWQWNFFGGTPSSSTDSAPSFICYNNAGVFPVVLIANNGSFTDTLTLSNYITVYPQPPAPVISQIGDSLFVSQGYAAFQWYFGSDSIQGATNYFYLATVSGNYNIVVTDENGCTVGAGIVNVSVGIKSFAVSGLRIEIFPNPFYDKIEITFDDNSNAKTNYTIISADGKNLFEEESFLKTKTLDLALLNKGIYFLKVSREKNFVVKKIVRL